MTLSYFEGKIKILGQHVYKMLSIWFFFAISGLKVYPLNDVINF